MPDLRPLQGVCLVPCPFQGVRIPGPRSLLRGYAWFQVPSEKVTLPLPGRYTPWKIQTLWEGTLLNWVKQTKTGNVQSGTSAYILAVNTTADTAY